MKDNNQLIANKIYEIENADWKQRKEWYDNNVTRWWLTDDIFMMKSKDCMMWYLWKYCESKCDHSLFKPVPMMHFYPDTITNILKATPWVHI